MADDRTPQHKLAAAPRRSPAAAKTQPVVADQRAQVRQPAVRLRSRVDAEVQRASNPRAQSTAQLLRWRAGDQGAHALVDRIRAEHLQAKLSISQPQDAQEQEADRMADTVMRMSAPGQGPAVRLASHSTLHHQASADEEKESEEPHEHASLLSRQEEGRAPVADSALLAGLLRERGSGTPLPGDTRAFFESRFQHDFSRVRIHDGSDTGAMAQSIHAQAFTHGHDVFFAPGRYRPDSDGGRQLLAHELTHVVQQGAASPSAQRESNFQGFSEEDVEQLDAGQPAPGEDTSDAAQTEIGQGGRTKVGKANRVSRETTRLDRKPGGRDSAALEPRGFPYPATLVGDEVALRSSPAGGLPNNRFHNLVASLRRDVTLVVEGSMRGWMNVRVTSGMALDRRTNEPVDAAGLKGWVSRELLVKAPLKPTPTPEPAAYTSFRAFSDAWPDRVTSADFIEQIWVNQSKQTWTNKALAAAGIVDADWRPLKRFRNNKPIFEKVYRYYARLYLADNRLKWAAMAKLAGGEVFRGFRDRIVPAEEFGEAMTRAGRRADGDLSVGDLLGGAYDLYAGSMDVVLLQMQKAIFMDLAWQHEAFREGGLKALVAAKARGEIGDELLAAWQDIDSGDAARVNSGNEVLLKREQRDVLQGGGTGGFYGKIQDIPDNDMIPETMSEEALSPIPGGKPFSKVVPGGDITKFEDRWKWLKKDMIPAFEKLDSATLDRLVKQSLDELADREF